MSTKDWILLLVPIFCNGIVIFVLQKIFEKKQISNNIKNDYASVLRRKIDISLDLHAKATRLANEANSKNDSLITKAIQEYVDSVLDVYYYYIQNKILFKSFDNQMENLSTLIVSLTDCSHQKETNVAKLCSLINEIRDVLMNVKTVCIQLKV